MAEPVEDDLSALGAQDNSQYTNHVSDYLATANADTRPSPLRSPRTPAHRKISPRTLSGVNTGVGAAAAAAPASPYSSSSPLSSPRSDNSSSNYNIDASGSTYALQVALRNMKERYHKLQKKMSFIEDDNQRLITGKSELFGEIGKLQENSIKLREKNLSLNQEIHTKHQECCSLKENFSALSQENMSLNRTLAKSMQENRRLSKQVNLLGDENGRLRDKLSLIATQVKTLPGGASIAAAATAFSNTLSNPTKTKIVPLSEDLESLGDDLLSSKLITSLKGSNDYGSSSDSSEDELTSSVQTATHRMRELLAYLQKQNQNLVQISPFIHSALENSHLQSESDMDTLKSGSANQLDRALSVLTFNEDVHNLDPEGKVERPGHYDDHQHHSGDGEHYQSRLATCGSVINPHLISNRGRPTSPLSPESTGDNNILVDSAVSDRNNSPFDWRQVQVSDDDASDLRPEMRTVSTSP
ncbi:unnamed protein product, partial [Meganyctiphanes norvegica]